jgi:hypothetical protein
LAKILFESIARSRPVFHHRRMEFLWETYQTAEPDSDGHEYVIDSQGYALRCQDLYGLVLGRVVVQAPWDGTRWGWSNDDYVWDWLHDLPTGATHASVESYETPAAAMDAFEECARKQDLCPVGTGTVADRVPVPLGGRDYVWVQIDRSGERRYFLRNEHYNEEAAVLFRTRTVRDDAEEDCDAPHRPEWSYEIRMNRLTRGGWGATPAHAMDTAEREMRSDPYQHFLQSKREREAERAALSDHEQNMLQAEEDAKELADAERERRREEERETLRRQARARWDLVCAQQDLHRPVVKLGDQAFEWKYQNLGISMMRYYLKSEDVLGTELGCVWCRLERDELFWEWSMLSLRTQAPGLGNEQRRFTSLDGALDDFEEFVREQRIQEWGRERLAERAPFRLHGAEYLWVVEVFLNDSYYLRNAHYSNTLATVTVDYGAPRERRWRFNLFLSGRPCDDESRFASAEAALAGCESYLRNRSFVNEREKPAADG